MLILLRPSLAVPPMNKKKPTQRSNTRVVSEAAKVRAEIVPQSVQTDTGTLSSDPDASIEQDLPVRLLCPFNDMIKELVLEVGNGQPSLRRRADAESFLRDRYSVDLRKAHDGFALAPEIEFSQSKLLVKNARTQYRHALAYAYAVYEWIINCDDFSKYVASIYKEANLDPNRHKKLLNAVVQATLLYEGKWRGNSSRDAQAIRFLITENVAPHEVEEFYEMHSGGAVEWAALYAQKCNEAGSSTRPHAPAQPHATLSWRSEEYTRPQRAAARDVRLELADCLEEVFVGNGEVYCFVVERDLNANFNMLSKCYFGRSTDVKKHKTAIQAIERVTGKFFKNEDPD